MALQDRASCGGASEATELQNKSPGVLDEDSEQRQRTKSIRLLIPDSLEFS